jgi:hypothetical protein
MIPVPIDGAIYMALPDKSASDGPRTYYHPLSPACQRAILSVLTIILFLGSIVVSQYQSNIYAANPGYGNTCSWYRIQNGDTLTGIARNYHTSIQTLVIANNISNPNLIITGQQLCIPSASYQVSYSSVSAPSSGFMSNNTVRWYDYNALQTSTRDQVTALLRQAAAQYGLPANLLLAIAWEESGWTQHVIARDGGIGVMQIMPYTAQAINSITHIQRNPYNLSDNIALGAQYLSWLWTNFHGDLNKVISGYNEGGWSVIHRGIFNWKYVKAVLSLMSRF